MTNITVQALWFVLVLFAGNGFTAPPDGSNDKATPCLREGVSLPQDYRVFIDRPTGFAFVCTPGGWTFVGNAGPRRN